MPTEAGWLLREGAVSVYTGWQICHHYAVRIVLDTNVLYAGLRSSRGASRVILELVADDRIELVITPTLFLEYEERLRGDPELQELGLTDDEIIGFLDELAAKSYRVRVDVRWRPISPDPDDDMVIECAVNGGAEAIVTFNTRDCKPARDLFGIGVLTPREFLLQFGSKQ